MTRSSGISPRKGRFWSKIKAVGAFGGSGLLAGAVWFALLPIVTRRLAPSDIGVYGAYRAAYQLAVQLAPLGASAFIMWNHLKADSNTRRLVATASAIALATSLLAFAISLLFQNGLLAIGLPLGAVAAAIGSAWLLNWSLMAESVLQMERQPVRFLSIRLVESLVFGIGVVTLLTVWSDWVVLVTAQTIGIAVAAMTAIMWLRRRQVLSFGPRRKELALLGRFGRQFLPHSIGVWSANYIDRYVVAAISGVEQAGLYVVAYSISMVFSALHEGVARAFAPLVVASITGNSSDRISSARAFYRYALWGLVGSAAVMIPSAWLVSWLVGSEFSQSAAFIPMLVLAQAFAGVSRYMTGYLLAGDLAPLRSKITVATALLNVILSVVFVGLVGAIGAAFATAITYLLGAIWAFRVVRGSGLLPSLREVGGAGVLVGLGG